MKKTIFLNSIFIFSLFIIISCNTANSTNKGDAKEVLNNTIKTEEEILITKPNNIKDYFLLIPDELILNISINDRKKILEIKDYQESQELGIYYLTETIDINNAFIRICSTGDGGGNNIEMTYFIKSDKTKLIAVNISSWDMLTESSELHFYTYENNIWTDVTTDVIPEINMSCFSKANTNVDNAAILVILPQKGKTIKVTLDAEALTELVDYDEAYIKVKEQLFCTKYDLTWNDGTFIVKNQTMK